MFISLVKIMVFKQLRDSAYAVWIVLFPPVLYCILALLWSRLPDGGRLLSGLSLFLSVTAGLMNQPLLFAQMREDRLLTRLLVTPLPARLVPPACVVASLLAAAVGQLLLVLTAFLWGDIRLSSVPGFLAASVTTLLAFLSAGLWLPVLWRGFLSVKNAGNLAILVLFAFAGLFFRLPGAFAAVHALDPLYRIYPWLLDAASASPGNAGLPGSVAILIGIGLSSLASDPRRVNI